MNKLSLLALSLCTTTLCFAQNPPQGTIIGQDSTNRVITTAVPFLTITPDARATGMGDVGVATSADVNSAYWNAGKLAFIDNGLGYGVSGSYTLG